MTVRDTRRMLIVLAVILGVVALACVGVLLSPLAKSREQKEADLRDLQSQLAQLRIENGPSIGIEGKLQSAGIDISKFYQQRLSGQYSQIDSALNKAAEGNNVKLMSVNYKPDKKSVEDLNRVDVDVTISGPYVNDVKFINAMERDKVFFVINSVSLVGNVNGVQLLVRAETYFRTGA